MRPGGVLCSGSIVFDTIVRPVGEAKWGTTTFVDSLEYHVGGNAANTSLALAKLGVPVKLLGAVGNDDQARFLLDRLGQAGVDASNVARHEEPTAATVVLVRAEGHRKFLHRLGVSREAFATPIQFPDDLCRGISHYHLASFFILPNFRAHAPETLKNARAAGLTISLDSNWDPQGRWMQDLRPCLPHLDFLFLNEDEAREITGYTDPARAAQRMLDAGVRHAIMKLGSQGCAIYTQTDQIICPAFDVEAKDTTGAGDCFAAGFLAALLDGASLKEAGLFGNAVGALSVQKVGAVTGVLTKTETKQWISENKYRACHHRP